MFIQKYFVSPSFSSSNGVRDTRYARSGRSFGHKLASHVCCGCTQSQDTSRAGRGSEHSSVWCPVVCCLSDTWQKLSHAEKQCLLRGETRSMATVGLQRCSQLVGPIFVHVHLLFPLLAREHFCRNTSSFFPAKEMRGQEPVRSSSNADWKVLTRTPESGVSASGSMLVWLPAGDPIIGKFYGHPQSYPLSRVTCQRCHCRILFELLHGVGFFTGRESGWDFFKRLFGGSYEFILQFVMAKKLKWVVRVVCGEQHFTGAFGILTCGSHCMSPEPNISGCLRFSGLTR